MTTRSNQQKSIWINLRRVISVGLLMLGATGFLSSSFAQDDAVDQETAVEDVQEDAQGDTLAELMPDRDGAVLLELTGAIGPALAHYIVGGIEDAQESSALIILEMDTPGGLDTSMREMIQAILASDVPVVTYVSPSGARAASAGAFILYASHVAAMAPGTAVGAATPIQMGGESPVPSDLPTETPGEDSEETAVPDALPQGTSATAPRTPLDAKAMNDAAALARDLAEMRGRNVEFAESMIRDATSINSTEALEMSVIEYRVRNLDELLEAMDGMVVSGSDGDLTVHSAGLTITRVPMTWVQNLITLITDPNVAFILMNFGMLGILIELYNPGGMLPGVVGVICLVLALYALSVIPFNAAGLALLIIGLLLMGAELFVISGGVLAVGGFISFGIGAFFLFDSSIPEFGLDWRVLTGTLVLFGGTLFVVVTYALSALGRKISAGPEELIGMVGKVIEWSGTSGTVFLDGESWQATSDAALEPGQAIKATDRAGNFLTVEAAT